MDRCRDASGRGFEASERPSDGLLLPPWLDLLPRRSSKDMALIDGSTASREPGCVASFCSASFCFLAAASAANLDGLPEEPPSRRSCGRIGSSMRPVMEVGTLNHGTSLNHSEGSIVPASKCQRSDMTKGLVLEERTSLFHIAYGPRYFEVALLAPANR